jgi:hypothetical protein
MVVSVSEAESSSMISVSVSEVSDEGYSYSDHAELAVEADSEGAPVLPVV